MGLTAEQIDQFDKDGFLAYGPLLTLGEVNKLLAHYADLSSGRPLATSGSRRRARRVILSIRS
jgi:hypothetical protein